MIGAPRFGITALLAVAVLAYSYELYLAKGIPLLMPAEERTLAYVTLPQEYVHYLTISAISAAVLAIAYIQIFGRKKSAWEFGVLMLSTLLILSILARLQLFMIATCGLAVFNYMRKRLTLKQVIVMSIFALAASNWFGNFRAGSGADYARSIYLLDRLPQWADFVAWPYSYTSLNFELLSRIIHGGYEHTLGAMTLVRFCPSLSHESFFHSLLLTLHGSIRDPTFGNSILILDSLISCHSLLLRGLRHLVVPASENAAYHNYSLDLWPCHLLAGFSLSRKWFCISSAICLCRWRIWLVVAFSRKRETVRPEAETVINMRIGLNPLYLIPGVVGGILRNVHGCIDQWFQAS